MADGFRSVMQLEGRLSEPPPSLVAMMHRLEGDVLILGAGGKMGPTLARMARRAADRAPAPRRVIAVSRFSDERARQRLHDAGVETIAGDLLNPHFLDQLPDADNVVFMAGTKFGTAEHAPHTWAVNAYLPALVCRRFRHARLVAFSTGNVYGMTPVAGGGSKETDPPRPVGEYANSGLARERMFEYFSGEQQTPVAIVRLNYACEVRYGVLVDIARQVLADEPIDLRMGYFNAIWQGDANAMGLLALEHASTPPFVINVAGPEVLSVQAVAQQFAHQMHRAAHFIGREAPDAFLSDASRAYRLFGEPTVSTAQMVQWIADWLQHDGETLGKPTHFQVRDGNF